MEVISEPVKKILKEYDFTFLYGTSMAVIIDESLGDEISYIGDLIHIVLTPKKSLNDPTVMLPGEDITIFKSHLIAIHTQEREVVTLTTEQQADWQRTVKTLVTDKVH